jgi:hypothetical protein
MNRQRAADVADRAANNEQNGSQRPPGGDHGNPPGNGDGRTAAELSDEELLAIFPGSTVIKEGDLEGAGPVHECGDPAHRALGRDWTAYEGRRICGECHPPAHPDYLGVSLAALHKHTAARTIPFEQDAPGCKLWFRRDELDAWRRGE